MKQITFITLAAPGFSYRTLHEIQLLMAQYDQQTITGNSPKTIQE